MSEGMLGMLPLSEVRGPRDDLEERLAGSEGNTVWLPALKRFLRKENPWEAPNAASQTVAPGATIDLGNGWCFTIHEIEELEVDYSISSDEIASRMNLDLEHDWEYRGTASQPRVRKVKAAIGCLNRNWTEEGVTELLGKPGCLLKGSGVWVREAYIARHPRYDGKGWIGFPDAKSSRWRFRHDRNVYFPDLWNDGAERWRRGLAWVEDERSPEYRLCLLCG